MTQKSYTTLLATTLAFALAFVALFNWLIDPYDIFNSPTIKNTTEIKPKAVTQAMLHKAYHLEDHSYDGLLLGNSRVYRGIDPNSAHLKNHKFYNLGIRSAHPIHMWHYLLHGNHNNKIKSVIMGLDYNIDTPSGEARADFVVDRLHSGNYQPHQKFIDFRDSLLSSSAFSDSLSTLRHQKRYKSYIDADGFQHLTKALGELNHFEKIEHHIKDRILTLHKKHPNNTKNDSYYIKKIFKYCYDNNIELTLFISPIHARLLEIFHETGVWKEFENWKINLLSMTIEAGNENNLPPIPIWDFAIFNQLNTEKITNRPNKWFYESSHYKPTYGEHILAQLRNKNNNIDPSQYKLGVKLREHTIYSHLENETFLLQKFSSKVGLREIK